MLQCNEIESRVARADVACLNLRGNQVAYAHAGLSARHLIIGKRGMVFGTVKFCNAAQRFVLVTPDDGLHEIVIQFSLLERLGIGCLRQGQRVKCAVEADRHGRASAKDVQLA